VELAQHQSRRLRVTSEHALGQRKLHGERHQALLCSVVDVPLESLGPSILRRHDALAGGSKLLDVRAQLLGQPDVPQDQPCLGGKVSDQFVL